MSTALQSIKQGSIGDLVEVLVGRDVTVRRAPSPVEVNDSNPGVVASYRLESGELGGIVLADLSVSCAVGAALSLIPATMAEEAVKLGELPDNLRENLFEVLNVLAQLFNDSGRPRRIMREMAFVPSEAIPDDVSPHLAERAEQVEFEVSVQGYGRGNLALIYVEATG